MNTWRTIMLGSRPLAAAALLAAGVSACDKPGGPVASEPEPPNFGGVGHGGVEAACFRMTGGGRIDKPEPAIAMLEPKNTPGTRDFATFGFQARPLHCNQLEGSGNITWVDHDPAEFGGGFTFHGRVTEFFEVGNHYAGQPGQPDPICGGFSGTGRARTRDGRTFDEVAFTVDHACDEGEPGVGHDHIGIHISIDDYSRSGILTGGNIQKHKLNNGNGPI